MALPTASAPTGAGIDPHAADRRRRERRRAPRVARRRRALGAQPAADRRRNGTARHRLRRVATRAAVRRPQPLRAHAERSCATRRARAAPPERPAVILEPLNDAACLGQLTTIARELARTTLVEMVAARLGSHDA